MAHEDMDKAAWCSKKVQQIDTTAPTRRVPRLLANCQSRVRGLIQMTRMNNHAWATTIQVDNKLISIGSKSVLAYREEITFG